MIEESGGLCVLAAERNDSRRVDRQLFGRCARQGDPGTARAFICLDDIVIRQFLPRFLRQILKVLARFKFGHGLVRIGYKYAQDVAEKRAFMRRKHVLKSDISLADALSFAGPEAESAAGNAPE